MKTSELKFRNYMKMIDKEPGQLNATQGRVSVEPQIHSKF